MIPLGFAPGLTSPVLDARKNLFATLIDFLEDPSHQVQLIQCKYKSYCHIQILYITPIYEWKINHIQEQFGTQLDLIWTFANTPFLKLFIIFKQGSDSPNGGPVHMKQHLSWLMHNLIQNSNVDLFQQNWQFYMIEVCCLSDRDRTILAQNLTQFWSN